MRGRTERPNRKHMRSEPSRGQRANWVVRWTQRPLRRCAGLLRSDHPKRHCRMGLALATQAAFRQSLVAEVRAAWPSVRRVTVADVTTITVVSLCLAAVPTYIAFREHR